jgi:hypothetical protein
MNDLPGPLDASWLGFDALRTARAHAFGQQPAHGRVANASAAGGPCRYTRETSSSCCFSTERARRRPPPVRSAGIDPHDPDAAVVLRSLKLTFGLELLVIHDDARPRPESIRERVKVRLRCSNNQPDPAFLIGVVEVSVEPRDRVHTPVLATHVCQITGTTDHRAHTAPLLDDLESGSVTTRRTGRRSLQGERRSACPDVDAPSESRATRSTTAEGAPNDQLIRGR